MLEDMKVIMEAAYYGTSFKEVKAQRRAAALEQIESTRAADAALVEETSPAPEAKKSLGRKK